jgi:vancomycin resistance protein VanJ
MISAARWSHTWCAWAALLTCILAGALRVSGFDREGWLLAFHYATPWPVVGAIAFFGSVLAGSHRVLRLTLAAVCAACIALWLNQSWKPAQVGADVRGDLRFAYWNAAGPQRRVGKVIEHARTFDADFLAIGEAGDPSEGTLNLWKGAFSGYTVLRVSEETLVAAKGTVKHHRSGWLPKMRYNIVEVLLRDRTLRVVIVDFDADLTRSRRPAFESLNTMLAGFADQPLVLMGDFNTPADSPYFKAMGGNFRDAWSVVGSGMAESWPVPLPVLRLDHVWLSPNLKATSLRQDWSLLSDHRAQILDLRVPSSP